MAHMPVNGWFAFTGPDEDVGPVEVEVVSGGPVLWSTQAGGVFEPEGQIGDGETEEFTGPGILQANKAMIDLRYPEPELPEAEIPEQGLPNGDGETRET